MSTPARREKPLKIDPTPHYPHIVLALNLIDTNPPLFHWLLFVPKPGQGDSKVQHGIKVHAVQDYSSGQSAVTWAFEAAPFTLATSGSVTAAAVIGHLKDKTEEQLVNVLATIPMVVPAVDIARENVFDCRVWIREALRRLHGAGFIHCPDVDALEAEMWGYGRPAAGAVEDETFKLAKLVTARNSCTL
uniref:Ubiquitin ligase complex F-box protein GRR1, putative n=1 Tax=Ganoderma boninense TaxID=34458 RepID=A0A5K1JVP0_9APHY|nr:Ubiquitin ligase complex F-box protein GRR1, putative [Ganoderma boninense]